MTERRTSDRRQRRRPTMNERRTGFDRRRVDYGGVWGAAAGAVRSLRDRPAILLVLLVEANLLNLCDYFLTRWGLALGAVSEANPIMRGLFVTDARLAGVVKVLLVLGVSLLVWRYRRFRPMLVSGLAVVCVLLLVVVYQVWGWAVLVA